MKAFRISLFATAVSLAACGGADTPAEELMEAADKYMTTGDGNCLPSGDYSIAYDQTISKQFWDNYETVTGSKVAGSRWVIFRCCI